MIEITIFTPTFNRANTLPRLYKSLCEQDCSDFIWLIVDDGSTDNTQDVVQNWINERRILISYIKQTNGGKMRAHNKAVKMCDTVLFYCIDSDDYLPSSAIQDILAKYHSLISIENLAGIVGIKQFEVNGIVQPVVPLGEEGLKSIRELSLGNRGLELSIAFFTEIIRQFPFPEIEGEKFILESVCYDQIDQKYRYAVLNKSISICEYQADGYSNNVIKLKKNNPKGWSLYFNQCILLTSDTVEEKIKNCALYIYFSRYSNMKHVYSRSNLKGIRYLAAYILSYYYQILVMR